MDKRRTATTTEQCWRNKDAASAVLIDITVNISKIRVLIWESNIMCNVNSKAIK